MNVSDAPYGAKEEARQEDVAAESVPQSGAVDCGCISRVNAELKAAGYNTGLETNLFGTPKALVATYQLESGRGKKKAVKMFASHCPFCGAAYHPSSRLSGATTESARVGEGE